MKKKTIKLFEAFAGIGAQYYALKRIPSINVEVIGISEWDIKALRAYRAIHYPDQKNVQIERNEALKELQKKSFSWNGSTPYDINKLKDDQIVELYNTDKIVNNFGSVQNLATLSKKQIPPRSDIFVYSFPCQDLATGGKGLGMKKGSGTRSGLLWELEHHLLRLKKVKKLPKILLLENVRTIYSPTHLGDLNLWLDFLNSLGYKKHLNLKLNALNYGLPQNRERAFIISVYKTTKLNIEFVKKGLEEDMVPKSSLDINKFIFLNKYKSEEDQAWLKRTPSREEMWRINKKDLSKNQFLGTITCNLDRSNNAGMFKYKNSYRLLTMREAFGLMGFDEEVYQRVNRLGFSYRQINKLIGNSIAVNVLESIFKNIIKNLK